MNKKTLGLLASAAVLLGTSQIASAADLPVKAMAAPAVVWNWTGFYIGGHVGAGWGTTETTLTGVSIVPPIIPPLAFSIPLSQNSRSGFLGGAQAGYNWQSGLFVFGVQADIAGMDVKGTTPCLLILSCTGKSDWLATATGRLGAVVLDRGLVYAKGGGAWMNTTHSVNLPNIGIGGIAGQELTSKESTAWGWTIGLGTEWMITRNWSAFVEYDYMEFDKKSETFLINPALTGPIRVNVNADIVNKLSVAKVGVNYKFDWGTPVMAKY
jgi:outer membrane immunogenic protein